MIFNTLDLVILGVIAASGILSMFRGFFSELFSLATWIVAIWLPLNYTEQFSILLPGTIESADARWYISAFVLFLGAMVIGGILSLMVRKILVAAGGGCMNRLLGFGIGVVRGGIIVSLVALLATSVPGVLNEKWWNESKVLPQVLKVSRFVQNQMPDSISKWFKTVGV